MRENRAYKVLVAVRGRFLTGKQIEEITKVKNVSSSISYLFKNGLLKRRVSGNKIGRLYEYSATELGEQRIDDPSSILKVKRPVHPNPIIPHQDTLAFKILRVIYDTEGAVQARDIWKKIGLGQSSRASVSGRLNDLYDSGFIQRKRHEPVGERWLFLYTLSSAGKEAVEKTLKEKPAIHIIEPPNKVYVNVRGNKILRVFKKNRHSWSYLNDLRGSISLDFFEEVRDSDILAVERNTTLGLEFTIPDGSEIPESYKLVNDLGDG